MTKLIFSPWDSILKISRKSLASVVLPLDEGPERPMRMVSICDCSTMVEVLVHSRVEKRVTGLGIFPRNGKCNISPPDLSHDMSYTTYAARPTVTYINSVHSWLIGRSQSRKSSSEGENNKSW
jgi:hypothetical protein